MANSAITQLTSKYKLPHATAVVEAARAFKPKEEDPVNPKLAVTVSDLEEEEGVVLVVDCRPLARVFNGQERLKNPALIQFCIRTTEKIISAQRYWVQLHKVPLFITWRPRHLNQLADEAANQCMNSGCDFVDWSQPLPDASILVRSKLLGFSDGGVRRDVRLAAVGWIIVAVVDGVCWLVGRGGKKVDCGEMGSFMAEAIALGFLLDNVLLLCNHKGVHDNSWCVNSILFFS